MSDDLLKQRLIGTGHGSSFEAVRRIDEMADEITRLRAEVERLREAERTAWERGRDAAAEVAEDMNPDIWDYHTGNRARIGTDPVAEAILAITPETSHD